jgi:serine/threonine-protein kinase OSR1/STK39
VGEKIARSKFIDTLRLHVKGGAGGMGYPKYGGVGGAGGNVYVVGDEGIAKT